MKHQILFITVTLYVYNYAIILSLKGIFLTHCVINTCIIILYYIMLNIKIEFVQVKELDVFIYCMIMSGSY